MVARLIPLLTFLRTDTPDTTPPSLVTQTASPLTPTSCRVTWQTNENATSQVNYGTTTGYGSSTTLDSALVRNHDQVITGLVASTTYHYRLVSADSAGNTLTTGDYTFVTPASGQDTTPPTITNVTVGSITTTSVSVSWDLSEPGTGQVEFGTTTAYGRFSTLESSFNYTHHIQTLSGLTAGTLYHFRVHSVDAAGNGAYSPDSTFTTQSGVAPPPAVVSTSVTGISSSGATVNWQTNVPTTGYVEYGLSASGGSNPYRSQVAGMTGLLGAWSLGEASGASFTDIKGLHNGTWDVTPTQGVAGALTGDTNTAVTLNGTTQYGHVGNDASNDYALGTGAYSLIVWFKRSATQGAMQFLWSKSSQGNLFFEADNKLTWDNDNNTIVRSSGTVTDTTTWHMAVVTHAAAGSTAKLYLDGADVSANTGSYSTSDSTNSFYLGQYRSGGSFFPGSLDELAYFGVELAPATVLALYHAGADSPSAYGTATTETNNLSTQHSVTLTGLTATTTYHYRVRGKDALTGTPQYYTSDDHSFATSDTGGSYPSDLQAAIDAASPGATIDVSGGPTYHQRITVNKSLTLRGAVLDGTGLGVPLQRGLLEVTAANVTIDHVSCSASAGAGIYLSSSADTVTVVDSHFDDNVQEGFALGEATDVTFLRCTFNRNNVARTIQEGFEHGGGKAHGTNIVFDTCEASYNGGPGIWFDQWYPDGTPVQDKVYNEGAIVRDCRTHHNSYAGIMIEVSTGNGSPILIQDNVSYNNGEAVNGWFWGAGILISNSSWVTVSGNTCVDNYDGISVVSQNRADAPAGAIEHVSVHDNYVVERISDPADGSDKGILVFTQDWAGPMETCGTNTGATNHFWSPYAEPRYGRFATWGGVTLDTLAKLNATPIGGSSVYMTTNEKDAQLAAVGL